MTNAPKSVIDILEWSLERQRRADTKSRLIYAQEELSRAMREFQDALRDNEEAEKKIAEVCAFIAANKAQEPGSNAPA